ncbi:hypothetical protein JS562_53895 [Agrobacterium sp. S2]|nr:hypothetical protein [Agrobacterium sp. S2]
MPLITVPPSLTSSFLGPSRLSVPRRDGRSRREEHGARGAVEGLQNSALGSDQEFDGIAKPKRRAIQGWGAF